MALTVRINLRLSSRMPRLRISNDKIADLLINEVNGKTLSPPDSKLFKQWLANSPYNRSIWNDLCNDTKLRSDLRRSCADDRSLFWKIIIEHRAALHNGMPRRPGNFWQRTIHSLTGIFEYNRHQ